MPSIRGGGRPSATGRPGTTAPPTEGPRRTVLRRRSLGPPPNVGLLRRLQSIQSYTTKPYLDQEILDLERSSAAAPGAEEPPGGEVHDPE